MQKKHSTWFSLAAVIFLSNVSCFGLENPVNRWIVKFRNDSSVTLRTHGNPSQVIHNLKAQLDKNLKLTRSLSVTQDQDLLWAANAVAITATDEQIKKIAVLENVETVLPVTYRKYDFDNPNSETFSMRWPWPWPQPTPEPDSSWGISKVKAPEVWEKYKIDGSGVVVGLIDSGVDAKHVLLAGRVIAFKDFTAAPQTEAYDDHGHGTHTAGTICASGGIGIAPGANLIAAKGFARDGSYTHEGLLKAMQWMMDPDGNPDTNDFPGMVSNSWNCDATHEGSDPVEKLFLDVVNNWTSMGILSIFAAGNDGPKGKIYVPACFVNTWTVGATKSDDNLAYFSSQGPSVWDVVTYMKPDISAPGEDIISCARGGGLTKKSGTSMACPHVTGLTALMLQANPKLSISEIRQIAEESSVDLGEKGKDKMFGSGRIDAFACISRILETTSFENLISGYQSALEKEKSLNNNPAVSPLAEPMEHYLIEKAKSLNEAEFNSLMNRYSKDLVLSGLFKQIKTARKFENIHSH
ncbi:MAG: S8 family serine peptidase [Candidatus Riflebacteria bacterium]|nr:S8 family serine peptidase [Candidatus Riflebacteria bacterium]